MVFQISRGVEQGPRGKQSSQRCSDELVSGVSHPPTVKGEWQHACDHSQSAIRDTWLVIDRLLMRWCQSHSSLTRTWRGIPSLRVFLCGHNKRSSLQGNCRCHVTPTQYSAQFFLWQSMGQSTTSGAKQLTDLGCTLGVPWVYLGYTLGVPCVYLGCTLGVPCVYLGCTLGIPWVYLVCTLGVPWVYLGCTLGVPCVYLGCTLGVPCVYLGCTLDVPCLYLVCTLCVPWVYLVCTLFVPNFPKVLTTKVMTKVIVKYNNPQSRLWQETHWRHPDWFTISKPVKTNEKATFFVFIDSQATTIHNGICARYQDSYNAFVLCNKSCTSELVSPVQHICLFFHNMCFASVT